MSEYDPKEILIITPSEQYTEKRQAESQNELLATVKELMAWSARQRRKCMMVAVAKWVGLLLLIATVAWVLA